MTYRIAPAQAVSAPLRAECRTRGMLVKRSTNKDKVVLGGLGWGQTLACSWLLSQELIIRVHTDLQKNQENYSETDSET